VVVQILSRKPTSGARPSGNFSILVKENQYSDLVKENQKNLPILFKIQFIIILDLIFLFYFHVMI
jgi:hypothetical protein